MMQYCFACYILLTHSLKCWSKYSFGAKAVMYSILPHTDVVANTIFLWVSFPGAVGCSKRKRLVAFVVTAPFYFHAFISSWVIPLLLLLLDLGWPFWGVFNRSTIAIRNIKRFYTAVDASSIVVYDSATTFATPDEKSLNLTYVSPKSTKSDLPRKKKPKMVSFLYDSGLTGFRSKFEYPTWKDRSVQWKDRGWTHRFMMRLWQERYRECPPKVCEEEMNFWFSFAQDCG